jgi:hypothetical protein
LEKYASAHGLPEQRLYNMLCMAYGADPVLFADVVADGYLPKYRADHCDYEYQTFKHAWAVGMMPHVDRGLARIVMNTEWLPQQASSTPAQNR